MLANLRSTNDPREIRDRVKIDLAREGRKAEFTDVIGERIMSFLVWVLQESMSFPLLPRDAVRRYLLHRTRGGAALQDLAEDLVALQEMFSRSLRLNLPIPGDMEIPALDTLKPAAPVVRAIPVPAEYTGPSFMTLVEQLQELMTRKGYQEVIITPTEIRRK